MWGVCEPSTIQQDLMIIHWAHKGKFPQRKKGASVEAKEEKRLAFWVKNNLKTIQRRHY